MPSLSKPWENGSVGHPPANRWGGSPGMGYPFVVLGGTAPTCYSPALTGVAFPFMRTESENGRSGRKILFVVSSPSGGGKTTLCRRLLAEVPGIRLSVSHTTRPPREGEKDGREYFFTEEKDFTRLIDEGAFMEWAQVFGRHRYGTSRAE